MDAAFCIELVGLDVQRLTLTSPGVLLILAMIATGGIFLLDLFYLKPHFTSQKSTALREQATRAQHAAGLALRTDERNLLRACAPMVHNAVLADWLGGSGNATSADQVVTRGLAVAEIEAAWVCDEQGRLIRGWRPDRDDTLRPFAAEDDPELAVMIRELAQGDATEATGLVDLPHGVAIFARQPVLDDGDQPRLLGHLWVVRSLGRSILANVGSTIGGELVLVPGEELPEGIATDDPTAYSMWMAGPDRVSVAWLAKDFAGKTLGYFKANLSIMHLYRQVTTARRMVLIVLSLSVGLALLVIVGTHILITGPVVRLLRRLQEIENGESSASDLARDLHGEPLMLARRLESAFDRLSRISKTDELTGLSNRRHFEEVLEAFYNQARRYNRPLSLMVMDLDLFKAINDTGGHHAGDELLKEVATVIERACRKADLPARFGGDEFAVLLPETSVSDAAAVGERIRRAVAGIHTALDTVHRNSTMSLGLTDLNVSEIDSPEAMMRVADSALYTAKDGGRNRLVTSHDLDGTRSAESTKVEDLAKKLAGLDTEFKTLFLRAVQEIILLLEHRDAHMADHARKVQHYAVLIASEMGLPERIVNRVQVSAMLHDVGMLAMPDSVLLCPSKLSEEQLTMMRRHPLLSVRIMEGMEFLEQEIPAVRYHHERFDGKGYPEGVVGSKIPLTARILCVADSLDAMTTGRRYRQAVSLTEAIKEMQRHAGTQFDPSVVDALIAVAVRMGDSLLDVPGKAGSAWLSDLLPVIDIEPPERSGPSRPRGTDRHDEPAPMPEAKTQPVEDTQ